MLGLALALVVPLAAVPCQGGEMVPARPPPRRQVSGAPPAAVAEVADVVEDAHPHVVEGPPVSVSVGAGRVPGWLREALSHTPGPTVTVARSVRPVWVPGRNLWVLLLAASLLTGPLVESIPGERAQRTWETLRASAISTGELLAGKWLAWTGGALVVATSGVSAGLVSGTQAVDVGLLGLPLVIAPVVALGLWLVHDVDDPAGAATIPVRVIPLVLVGTVVAALLLQDSHPGLASLVPFGSPLLLAAGLPEASDWLPAATLSSSVTTVVLLGTTARAIGRGNRRRAAARLAGLVPVLVAAWIWWAAVVGPKLWRLAGSPLRPGDALPTVAGGVGLGLLAAVLHLRASCPRSSGRSAWGLAALVGAGLALLDHLLPELSVGGGLQPALAGRPTSVLLAAGVGAAGQELLFRGVLAGRMGPWLAGLAWALVTRPLDPAMGVAGGLALGWCHHKGGLRASLLAHLLWLALSAWGA